MKYSVGQTVKVKAFRRWDSNRTIHPCPEDILCYFCKEIIFSKIVGIVSDIKYIILYSKGWHIDKNPYYKYQIDQDLFDPENDRLWGINEQSIISSINNGFTQNITSGSDGEICMICNNFSPFSQVNFKKEEQTKFMCFGCRSTNLSMIQNQGWSLI